MFSAGVLHGLVRRYSEGELVEECRYENGQLHGPYWRTLPQGTYRISQVASEAGTFDRGVRIGTLRLLDPFDIEVTEFDLGTTAIDDSTLKLDALSMFPRTMSSWLDLADRAFHEGRREEGIVAVARATAKGADPAILAQTIERMTLPVTVEEAARLAAAVQEESSPRLLLAALVAGATPTQVFARLSAVLSGSVALDMIEAAIAIATDPVPLLFARGLLRVLSGNVAGARHDARTLRWMRPNEFALLSEAIAAIEDPVTDHVA
jgi:hypothetical protein